MALSLPGARPQQPGQGERRESATDVRLDGDEMTADADDSDAGDVSRTYIYPPSPRRASSAAHAGWCPS